MADKLIRNNSKFSHAAFMKTPFKLKDLGSFKPTVSGLPGLRQKRFPKYSRRPIPFRKLWERLEWIEPESGPPVQVALDIGSTSVRSLMLEHTDDKIRLTDLRFVPCSSEPITNLAQELKRKNKSLKPFALCIVGTLFAGSFSPLIYLLIEKDLVALEKTDKGMHLVLQCLYDRVQK